MSQRHPRIALYSPGVVGLGHFRRQLLIAHTLARALPDATILLIAETREAGAFTIAPGIDCLILPGLRKGPDGRLEPRHLAVACDELVALRRGAIDAAVAAFDPDVFIVDKLPRGALCELDSTLAMLKNRPARCVLGLRDILDEPTAVARDWARTRDIQTIRDYYHAVWIYGDPKFYDLTRQYSVPADLAPKMKHIGYLDQRRQLELADPWRDAAWANELTGKRFALCLLGGGQDGAALATAFADARLQAGTHGVIVTGPFMAPEVKRQLNATAAGRPRLHILEFVHEPAALILHADRIVAMGGYNTVGEILSFGKHALLAPRSHPRREQTIRAQILQRMGLVDVLMSEEVTPQNIGRWLSSVPPQPKSARDLLDFAGLERLPGLVTQLLDTVRT